MNLPRFAVKYPISVIMLFLGIILLGQISLRELGTDLLPDISSPKIVVKIEAGEIPPEEMERNYTERVESFVSTLNKVKRVSSSSRTGVSIVTVEFMWETDMDFALLDVQKAVAPFSNDRQISNISIDRFDPRSAPIMTVSVIPKDERDLDEVRSDVEKVIKLRLERLDGVAAAVLTGGREKEIVIRMLPYRLQAYGLQPGDIQRSIQATNVNLSGGEIEDNEKVYLVKGIGKFRDLDDLRNLVVGYRTFDPGNGRNQQAANRFDPGSRVPVYLADVAEVLYRDKDFNSIVRFNGKEGLGIALYKESKSNTVTTSRQIREALEGLRLDLPDLELTIAKDQAGFIENAIKIHGDKYDYSQVEYKNSRIKVKIICFDHGVFEQLPGNHLQKVGCSVCGGTSKSTIEEFINRCNEIHKNKYD
ncbi:efflux RND transporter permease subunit, partial [candidate division KSB1 bacterium]|nr:efflux RND transporter permease subunit [candidate division KSB1 bacterium]